MIIFVANDSAAFAKRLAKELPVTGWKAIISNNNANLYNSMVAAAQKDYEIVQVFQTLESNVGNPNFHYVRPFET